MGEPLTFLFLLNQSIEYLCSKQAVNSHGYALSPSKEHRKHIKDKHKQRNIPHLVYRFLFIEYTNFENESSVFPLNPLSLQLLGEDYGQKCSS